MFASDSSNFTDAGLIGNRNTALPLNFNLLQKNQGWRVCPPPIANLALNSPGKDAGQRIPTDSFGSKAGPDAPVAAAKTAKQDQSRDCFGDRTI